MDWSDRAGEAGLTSEYEFLYGYVSRLVHCKPVSFVTNQKNLEHREMIMFIRFILFLISDIIRIARSRTVT